MQKRKILHICKKRPKNKKIVRNGKFTLTKIDDFKKRNYEKSSQIRDHIF